MPTPPAMGTGQAEAGMLVDVKVTVSIIVII